MSKQAMLLQGAHILTLIGQKADDKDKLTALVETGLLADLLEAPDVRSLDRNSFRKFLGLSPLVPEVITLSVDYGMTLEQMIAAGNYDWANSDLNAKNFLAKNRERGVCQFEFDIVGFSENTSTESVLLKLRDNKSNPPWAPAQIEHLLAFGAAFPDIQKENPLIALGSVARICGVQYVPYLGENDSEGRRLGLFQFENKWNSLYRFLRVRTVPTDIGVT